MLKEYFKENESYKLPELILSEIFSERKNIFFDKLCENKNLNEDFLNEEFQTEHGDRDSLKQDYTPQCLSRLIAELSKNNYNGNYVADICAGTGSLSIALWNINNNIKFVCEELSERAVPFLLINMAIRNIECFILQGNSIKREYNTIYKLTKGDRYSNIQKIDEMPNLEIDYTISNPPYSISWEQATTECNKEYGKAPKSKADYEFILNCMSRSSEKKAFIIVPHGVLFRGASEGEIRKKIIDKKELSAIIGVPDKLFLYTCIPVCVFITGSNSNNVLFIDASKNFIKSGKQNIIIDENIKKIANVYNNRISQDKYSNLVGQQEIEKNDFNLNIPRYVDTFEEEFVPNIIDTSREIINIKAELLSNKNTIIEYINELYGNDDIEELKRIIEDVL